MRRQCDGEAHYFRFADDFLACFRYKADAEQFYRQLKERLEEFGLELAEEKTHCIEFGCFARQDAQARGHKPSGFPFLGFTHYCGKTKKGYFKVKRRTSRKKFGQSLHNFSDWARMARRVLRKGEMIRQARIRVMGNLNYYAITDNTDLCSTYLYRATQILFKWLNRKSQRKGYNWAQFNQVLDLLDWPVVRVRKDLNPFRREEAC
ncbi:hypothetical protein PDESU_05249 [Pontiella desulfatans]|uniref:Reverse transcriptase domain-containing protein n=1 Tax=Pontiella desulfatans TaxID=2750659 RepID=A0A6C2U978_PONDE|nr:hypothetical protein PDESU_05249 [Pontiella desulfatans]